PERLAANSAATYTVKISGTGNLTFVQAPKLALPGSFEQYNVKTIESINPTASGITGYRQFEYPFIARAEGSYDLEPVEFSYFDPALKRYETLSSKPLAIEITPDGSGGGEAVVMQGRGMSKEEVRLLGQDIRFIRLGAPRLGPERRPFLFSSGYWALLGAILAAFGGAYALLRKRIRESQNVALVRGRRANKVAVQRFRTARKYMEEQNRHAFYEEMLRALWGYMSDRFNIPVANLTKENVREELHKRGADPELQQRFTAIITRCDEAQYSPVATAQMSEVYTEGVDLVSRIEGAIKR
ncbi:MAG: BatD family protein, partial [Alistipes sp.]|nr:BatD family protein [Alistipes sp.]